MNDKLVEELRLRILYDLRFVLHPDDFSNAMLVIDKHFDLVT